MTLRKYSARRLLEDNNNESIWDVVTGQFILVFDDGTEIETNYAATITSFYCWELFRQYPLVKMSARHHITSLQRGTLRSDDVLDLLTVISRDIWAVYESNNLISFEEFQGAELYQREQLVANYDVLAELIYSIVNESYNGTSYEIEDCVESIDALDFVEFCTHPEVVRMKAELPNSMESADRIDSFVRELIMNDERFDENAIARGCRSGSLKLPQTLQCVGVRGEQTDIDGTPFPCIIMAGFADGFLKLPYIAQESRSASRSLNLAADDLKRTEFFSRRLQFQAQQLAHVKMGDCGSEHYLPFRVGKAVVDDQGNRHVTGDLKLFLGKYYLDEATGELKIVGRDDTHLLGTTVKFRTPKGCLVPATEPNTICSTCFGTIAHSLPPKTNIGWQASTDMMKQASQGVLSSKHRQGNATTKAVNLSDDAIGIVKVSKDGNSIAFDEKIRNRHAKLAIRKQDIQGVMGLVENKRPEDLTSEFAPSLYSDIPHFVVLYHERNDPNSHQYESVVQIDDGKLGAYLSRKMIEYIMIHGMDPDASGYMVVDMADWVWSNEIIRCPLRDFDLSEHAEEIADLLESKVSEMEVRDSVISIDGFIQEVFDFVNQQLRVHLSVMETIIYSLMIRSADKRDYSLPHPGTEYGIGVKQMTMRYRSAAPLLAYQDHKRYLMNPESFLITNRPDHPMDVIVCPQEVLSYNGENRKNQS